MQHRANDLDLRVQHRRVTIERVNLKQRLAIIQAHAEQPLQPPVNRQLVPLIPRYQLASHRLRGGSFSLTSAAAPYVCAHSFRVHSWWLGGRGYPAAKRLALRRLLGEISDALGGWRQSADRLGNCAH